MEKSSAFVAQRITVTCSAALWETPASLVYNEVNKSDWKDKQVNPHQGEAQVSEWVLDQSNSLHGVITLGPRSQQISAILCQLNLFKIRQEALMIPRAEVGNQTVLNSLFHLKCKGQKVT